MDFLELIMSLEDELLDKKGFFGGKVDLDKCRKIVSELRHSFPDVIREAAMIVAERERYLGEAKSIYENTLAEADRQATRIISESELNKRAEQEAVRKLSAADARCSNLVAETKKYIDGMFSEIERYFGDILSTVRENRIQLRPPSRPDNRGGGEGQ